MWSSLTLLSQLTAPPKIFNVSVEFSCNVYLEDSVPVTIKWMVSGIGYETSKHSVIFSPTVWSCRGGSGISRRCESGCGVG